IFYILPYFGNVRVFKHGFENVNDRCCFRFICGCGHIIGFPFSKEKDKPTISAVNGSIPVASVSKHKVRTSFNNAANSCKACSPSTSRYSCAVLEIVLKVCSTALSVVGSEG